MDHPEETKKPILFTGMGGVLGAGLAEHCARYPLDVLVAGRVPPSTLIAALLRNPGPGQAAALDGGGTDPGQAAAAGFCGLDLEQPGAAAALIEQLRPRALLHAAAMARQDQCERQPQRAERINVDAVAEILQALAGYGGRLVYCSTDQVFDGGAESYSEDAAVRPLHHYGATKARAEELVLAAGQCVVRLPLLLGPQVAPGRMGADHAVLANSARGEVMSLFTDEVRAPARAALLWPALLRLLRNEANGVFHLGGADAVSRHELGRRVCGRAGVEFLHRAATLSEWNGPPRPPRLVLSCARAAGELGFRPPDLRESLFPIGADRHD